MLTKATETDRVSLVDNAEQPDQRRPKKKRKRKRTHLQYYFILGAILVLLLFLVFLIQRLPGPAEKVRNTTEEDASGKEISGIRDSTVSELPITGADTSHISPRIPETVSSGESLPPQVSPQRGERERGFPLYVVIDDVGYDLKALRKFLDFPGEITFAILPGLPFTREASEMVHRAGKTVILHQPMEPHGDEDPGDRAILTSMRDEEIEAVLERNLSEVPYAVGMNNHMGSKATEDTRVMRIVLDFCRRKGLLFLDSRTSSYTMAAELSEDTPGVVCISRNSMFLDNERDKESIVKAFGGPRCGEKNGQGGDDWSRNFGGAGRIAARDVSIPHRRRLHLQGSIRFHLRHRGTA